MCEALARVEAFAECSCRNTYREDHVSDRIISCLIQCARLPRPLVLGVARECSCGNTCLDMLR